MWISQATTVVYTLNDNLVLVEIGAVLLLLGTLAFVASRLNFSAVPLFLLLGVAFGNGGLVPLNISASFLNIGAQIGALLLLLLLGLEYSAAELTHAVRQKKSISVIDFLFNALPGAFLALILHWGLIGALILGGITFVSSSGIAAELIREFGYQRSEIARRTIGVLVVEDLLLAPYLPLVGAMVTGASVLLGILSVSLALVITGLVLLLGVKRANLVSGLFRRHDPASLLLTVFGLALLAAGAATYAGFSGVVAAFLVGLLLTGEVASVARMRLSPLRDFFSAIYFLFFGLSTNPRDIPAILPIALILGILGILGKSFTAWWLARDMTDEMSWKRISGFLIPRGEFSIVIAGIASAQNFGSKLQAITITYVVLTTISGSFLVRFARSRFVDRDGR